MLNVGLPAVLVTVCVFRIFAAGFGTVTSADLFVFVPAVTTLALAPYAVLFSSVWRLSIVAQHSIAITPFTMTTAERPG